MATIPNLNGIKVGLTILFDGEPYMVQVSNFLRMQQRKPVMQTKLKHVVTGKVIEYSFKAGETVETADMERAKANFLYNDHEGAHFMDTATYEQFTFTDEQLGPKKQFLKDGMEVQVLLFDEKPINIELPAKVELKVVIAEPGVRGDSAQGRVMKEAELENGTKIKVPLFVKEGDTVRINTDTGEYSERVEKK